MNNTIGINLTRRCNLNCNYCYVGKYLNMENEQNNNLDISIEKIKERIEKFNIDTVFLTGGEPFLYPQLEELINYLENNNISINIATNGLLINNDTIDLLKNKNIVLLLSIREEFKEKYSFINDLIKNKIKIIIYHLPNISSPDFLREFFLKYNYIKDMRLLYDSKNTPTAKEWFSIVKKIYNSLEDLNLNTQMEIGFLPKSHKIVLSERKGAVDRLYMDTQGLLYNCPLMVLNTKGKEDLPLEKCSVKTCPVLSKKTDLNNTYQNVCCFILSDIKTINKFIR